MKKVNQELLDRYDYRRTVPLRGLEINGRLALTGIDPEQIGDLDRLMEVTVEALLTANDVNNVYSIEPNAAIVILGVGYPFVGVSNPKVYPTP